MTAEAWLERVLRNNAWLIVGFALLLAVWEMLRPRVTHRGKTGQSPLARRWGIHFSLSLVSSLFHHLLPGLSSLLVVSVAQSNPFGLLNRGGIPYSLQILLTVTVLDLVAYWRHRFTHSVPFAWRLHLLHHSDRDMDFTNAFRFHPLEMVFSMLIQSCAVLILAPPAAGVAVAAVGFSLVTLYEHANIELPQSIERAMRWVLISPALHRIHHSLEETAQHRNFGDTFVFWDRIFGTYADESFAYDSGIGLKEVSPEDSIEILHVLGAPFGR